MKKEGACSGVTDKYTVHSAPMSDFLNGLKCYFDTGGYGNAFKNPYDAAEEIRSLQLQQLIKKRVLLILDT